MEVHIESVRGFFETKRLIETMGIQGSQIPARHLFKVRVLQQTLHQEASKAPALKSLQNKEVLQICTGRAVGDGAGEANLLAVQQQANTRRQTERLEDLIPAERLAPV